MYMITVYLAIKVGTWLWVAKRAKTSVPSIVPITWWGSGWTSGANTTPCVHAVITSMHSYKFIAQLQEKCQTHRLIVPLHNIIVPRVS